MSAQPLSLEDAEVEVAGKEAGRDYRRAVDYLLSLIDYERVAPKSRGPRSFNLDGIRALLEELGSPERGLPAVHIAGTKGKGSTAAMLAAMLQAGGLCTGLFTSPHMERFEERMTVDGALPTEEEVAAVVEEVRTAAERIPHFRSHSLSFFEATTAAAWLLFRRRAADVVVLETGLGGRLDATNVCRPIATVITSISRDHTHLLGESLSDIAREKAGIIKPGVPVVSGVADASARAVIAETAADRYAPLIQLGDDLHVRGARLLDEATPGGFGLWTADVVTPATTHPDVRPPLMGRHQLDNAALAVAVLDELKPTGIVLDDAAIDAGLRSVHWPLRIEVVAQHPLVIVDSAHNDASISALLETIAAVPAGRRRLIFGTSQDKDAGGMLRQLSGRFDDITLTAYESNPRALPVDRLCRVAATVGVEGFERQRSPLAACDSVRARATADDLVCVTGSFFLAAEVRRHVCERGARIQGYGGGTQEARG